MTCSGGVLFFMHPQWFPLVAWGGVANDVWLPRMWTAGTVLLLQRLPHAFANGVSAAGMCNMGETGYVSCIRVEFFLLCHSRCGTTTTVPAAGH